jgi:hypothetical protein
MFYYIYVIFCFRLARLKCRLCVGTHCTINNVCLYCVCVNVRVCVLVCGFRINLCSIPSYQVSVWHQMTLAFIDVCIEYVRDK